MHVSHHFRPFAFRTDVSNDLHIARKRLRKSNEVSPVKGRFSEDTPAHDEEPDERQEPYGPARHAAADSPDGAEFEPPPAPIEIAITPPVSPLDTLLAGILSKAPATNEAPAQKPAKTPAVSIDALLARMRGAPPQL